MARDDFRVAVKEAIAKRVALKCSRCGALTVGPHTTNIKVVNVGVAAHITAASAGGPRFDPKLSSDERASIENAVWLCQTCAKLIDSDTDAYPVATIRTWKVVAEARTKRELNGNASDYYPQPPAALHAPIPRIDGLPYDEAREKLVRAGWQPSRRHWTHGTDVDMLYSNGLHFWQKEYHEIRHASGTGLAHCSFGFQDVYGTKLMVVTAGEVDEELGATAYVWNWRFTDDLDS